MADPRHGDVTVCKMSADSTAPDYLAAPLAHAGQPNSIGPVQMNVGVVPAIDTIKSAPLRQLGSPYHGSDSTEPLSVSRKRKITDEDSDCCDDDSDGRSVRGTEADAKGAAKPVNHSEIEKRRRDKMNHLIIEIASLVPMCSAMSTRKLDKLTVLRWAVQHIKTTRGSVSNFCQGVYKPSFVASDEMKEMLQQATDGFLIVIGCEDGKVLHASDSMTRYLGWEYRNMVGHCLFHFIHPEDLTELKEQLAPIDGGDCIGPKSTLQKQDPSLPSTNLGAALFSPGGKRSFFCRLRLKHREGDKHALFVNQEDLKHKTKHPHYQPFHCTGFLKNIPPHPNTPAVGVTESHLLSPSGTLISPPLVNHHGGNMDSPSEVGGENVLSIASLILLVRPVNLGTDAKRISSSKNRSVNLKLNSECRINFVDQRVHHVTGHLPQQLMLRSFYELVPDEDVKLIKTTRQKVINSERIVTFPIQHGIINNTGSIIPVISHWTGLINPWTSNLEFITVKIEILRPENNSHKIVTQQVPQVSHAINSQMVIRAYDQTGNLAESKLMQKLTDLPLPIDPAFSSSSPLTSRGSARMGSLFRSGLPMETTNQSPCNSINQSL